MPDEEDYSPSEDTEEDEAASPEEQSPASELEADIPSDAPAADDTASAVAEADFDTDDTAWAADDSTDWRAGDDEYNFAADATADVDFDPADTAEADPLFFDDTAVDPSAFDDSSLNSLKSQDLYMESVSEILTKIWNTCEMWVSTIEPRVTLRDALHDRAGLTRARTNLLIFALSFL
ncbi:hypothetical protein [Gloeobacter kilaueensis]|uniref:Uncharacterized protein n=1 Tax=Gloeobacter kilaueensis (strain ATCC BAA-2537 / CCAP 1431/1 / ULC 316 / JS1) TaxID=1183438 RepID=U5QFD1_GLOK1|nr:hypothetical protein [Gloeobacter kilaueensis]AGY57682.1 hypothetical protein GKIL_1436 [Gloeobacter kilaueensis JS1]